MATESVMDKIKKLDEQREKLLNDAKVVSRRWWKYEGGVISG